MAKEKLPVTEELAGSSSAILYCALLNEVSEIAEDHVPKKGVDGKAYAPQFAFLNSTLRKWPVAGQEETEDGGPELLRHAQPRRARPHRDQGCTGEGSRCGQEGLMARGRGEQAR